LHFGQVPTIPGSVAPIPLHAGHLAYLVTVIGISAPLYIYSNVTSTYYPIGLA